MARPERNTVDYFPFLCEEGKKMFYLEETYGNDGFATFVKLLRELAKTEYHYLDLSKNTTIMFLSAKCKVSKEVLLSIINDLVDLEKFDSVLWKENSIIWCQDFINTIQDAYIKRKNNCITYDGLLTLLDSLGVRKLSKSNTKGVKNSQSKVKYSKVKESIEDIYNAYPTKCVVRGAANGKGKKDKEKIKSLLEEYSKDHLIKVINWYIEECKKSNTYMKNFGTFLNNLPDIEETTELAKSETKKVFKTTW